MVGIEPWNPFNNRNPNLLSAREDWMDVGPFKMLTLLITSIKAKIALTQNIVLIT